MAKSFIDVVQDSPRTGLGIPVKTKKKPSLEPIHRLRNRLSALNFTGGWFQLKVAYDSSVILSPGTGTSQEKTKKNPPPNDMDSRIRPRRRTTGEGPDAI